MILRILRVLRILKDFKGFLRGSMVSCGLLEVSKGRGDPRESLGSLTAFYPTSGDQIKLNFSLLCL